MDTRPRSGSRRGGPPARLLETLEVLEHRSRLVWAVAIAGCVFGLLLALLVPSLVPPTALMGAGVALASLLLGIAAAIAADAGDGVIRGPRHVRAVGGELVEVVPGPPAAHDLTGLAAAVLEARGDGRLLLGIGTASIGDGDAVAWAHALGTAIARRDASVLIVELAAGATPTAGVHEVVSEGLTLGRAVGFERDLKLAYLGAGRDADAALAATATFATRLPKDLDVLLVALPPVTARGVVGTAKVLDTVLVLAARGRTPRVRLQAGIQALEAAGTAAQVLLVDDRGGAPRTATAGSPPPEASRHLERGRDPRAPSPPSSTVSSTSSSSSVSRSSDGLRHPPGLPRPGERDRAGAPEGTASPAGGRPLAPSPGQASPTSPSTPRSEGGQPGAVGSGPAESDLDVAARTPPDLRGSARPGSEQAGEGSGGSRRPDLTPPPARHDPTRSPSPSVRVVRDVPPTPRRPLTSGPPASQRPGQPSATASTAGAGRDAPAASEPREVDVEVGPPVRDPAGRTDDASAAEDAAGPRSREILLAAGAAAAAAEVVERPAAPERDVDAADEPPADGPTTHVDDAETRRAATAEPASRPRPETSSEGTDGDGGHPDAAGDGRPGVAPGTTTPADPGTAPARRVEPGAGADPSPPRDAAPDLRLPSVAPSSPPPGDGSPGTAAPERSPAPSPAPSPAGRPSASPSAGAPPSAPPAGGPPSGGHAPSAPPAGGPPSGGPAPSAPTAALPSSPPAGGQGHRPAPTAAAAAPPETAASTRAADDTDEIPAVTAGRESRPQLAPEDDPLRTTAQLALLVDELGARGDADDSDVLPGLPLAPDDHHRGGGPPFG